MTQFHGTLAQEPGEHPAFAGGRGLFGPAIACLYEIAAYAAFFVTFLYAIGFVDELIVPKTTASAAMDGALEVGVGGALAWVGEEVWAGDAEAWVGEEVWGARSSETA